jgi:hypothetical protein
MACTFELQRADGTPADPPTLTTVASSWRAGDTIPLGRRTLLVIEVRDSEPDKPLVLVVEDMAAAVAGSREQRSRRPGGRGTC